VATVGSEPVREQWYIGFIKTHTKKYWFERLWFKYSHVFAFKPDGDKWLVVDCTIKNIYAYTADNDEMRGVLNAPEIEEIKLLRIKAREPKDQSFTLMPIYCVSVVKKILGVTTLALSPDGLYSYLIKHGAEKVKSI
jgi:hypothetical protein